jgi:phospholipid/cholesterol/gamma-HCH transport system permease protein
VAGRSGSAIAAEVATMKFTEELDALETMSLDPLRFVAVPKLWAMVLCVPMLTIMADFVGIVGGVVVGITAMGIAPEAFIDQVMGALFVRDVLSGLVKSFTFAWAITVVGVFHGLGYSGGAAGVGRATTASVVTSIFVIIVLDCFWGLVFYLG